VNPDIDTQLRDYADHVRSMISVIEVEEILDQPSEVEPDHRLMTLRRDRKRPGWGVAIAAAALVLVVVGGVSLIVSGLSDDSTPTGDSDGLPLVEIDFGDIPPFRATYEVAPFPSHDDATNSELAVVQISYGGSGVGYRLDGVEGRPDLPTDVSPEGVVIWDGEQIGEYLGHEPEDEEFARERTDPGYEPLDFFGWHTSDPSWQEFCRTLNHEDLADEVVAGRTARHIRCVGVRDDLQLWVDAETGLVLRLTGSRGGFPRLSTGDFEAIAIEYNPVFAPDTFLVAAPPGVPDAGLDDPSDLSEGPPDFSEPSSSDFGPGITGSEGFSIPQGEVLPSFTGPLLGGGTFDLSELRGRPVFLMLWADWCPPCVDNLNAFQALAGQWDDRVEFVSVLTSESTPEFADAIVQEHEFTIPVVIDLTDSLWNPLSIPNWVLIDSQGRALGGWSGGSDTQILNQLLEQFLQ
jgi:thiol-disulfide isomerase/thioredoxin